MFDTGMARSPEQDLVAVMDGLAAQEPADLPGPVALERTRLLLAQADRLKTLALQALSDVDARRLFVLDGAPTTSAWVRAQAVAAVDRREVTLARRLRSVPQVAAELLGGRLSAEAAARVTTAVSKARPFLDRPDGLIDGQPGEPVLCGVLVDGICTLLAEQTGGAPANDPEQRGLRSQLQGIVDAEVGQRERLEAALVLFAQRSQPALLPSGLALLLDALLPAEHDARARQAEQETGLNLHRDPSGSGWRISGQLDDELGELLHTVVTAVEAVDEQNPADTAAWRAARQDGELDGLEPQEWPAEQARPRSRPVRRHDALTAALRMLLGSGALGRRDKALPHLVITVGLDYLDALPGALPARAASGARWTRRQLRRLGCDSVFTRLVLDARRRVVEASHTTRTAKAVERLITSVEWGATCSRNGCTNGPATGHRLVPHHAELFSRTGTTSLQDTVPLCEGDHHHVHDGRILQLKDGRWIGPDGWVRRDAA